MIPKTFKKVTLQEKFYFDTLKNEIATVLLLASGHLSHAFGISWLCFLAGWAENWAKLYM